MKLRWLAGAVVVQCLALAVLVGTWWPGGPNEENLADLASQYEVVRVDNISCGQGGTAQCGWTFVIAHDSSEADLARELERVGIDPFQIEEIAPGQSRVILSWIEGDPGAWSVLTALFLLVGIAVTSLTALVVLIRHARGAVSELRSGQRSSEKAGG